MEPWLQYLSETNPSYLEQALRQFRYQINLRDNEIERLKGIIELLEIK